MQQADESISIDVARIVRATEAEGPGRRFALWLQGCPLRCPGCCNPEMLPFRLGSSQPLRDVLTELDEAQREDGVTGITLMGGEPTARQHVAASAALARESRQRGLSVLLFSGFRLEELRARQDAHTNELLAQTDVLIDGPYDARQPEERRRWIGSRNQGLHFLTARYDHDDFALDGSRRNSLELRLQNGELTVNGFPAKSAVGLWRRIDAAPTRRAEEGAD